MPLKDDVLKEVKSPTQQLQEFKLNPTENILFEPIKLTPRGIELFRANQALVTSNMQSGSFTKIDVSGAVEVNLIKGSGSSYEIVGTEEQKEMVQVTETDGILIIRPGKWKKEWNNKEFPAINVTMSTIEGIKVMGASSLKSKDEFETANVMIDLSGASDLEVNFKAQKMTIDQNGASNIKIKGSVENLKVNASGASDLKMKDCIVQVAEIICSGASDVSINVKKELTGSATGASDLKYVEKPVTLDVKSSGASDVKKL